MMWRQKQTPGCLKRKRDDDDETLNSSFQVPSYARITNARVRAGRKAHLLALPPRLRAHIFRLALVRIDPIPVSTDDVAASAESGLLRVSHDVRAEALAIFYVENDFDLRVRGFDAAALLPWLGRAEGHRVRAAESGCEGEVKMEDPIPISTTLAADTLMPGLKTLSPSQARVLEKQRAYTSTAIPTSPASLGTIAWTIPFEPNWRNLVKWMELFHAGQLLGPPKDDEGASQERAAFAVFDVVEALRGEEWGMVVKVLPGLRAMLGAGEGWWLADEQGAGGVEDGGVGKEETA